MQNIASCEESEFNELTPYEKNQIELIKKWKAEEPGVVSQGMGAILFPLTWLVDKVVPKAAIRGALDFANSLGDWLADTGDIKRDGGVQTIIELKTKNLDLSDKLANEVHDWAIGLAAAEGGGLGVGGFLLLAIDIPTLITLSLRTIHKIGLCYGYETTTEDDKNFILGILSVSGANSIEEKVGALAMLRSIEVMLAKVAWQEMAKLAAEKGAKQILSKEAIILAVRNLAKQLGINLTKRKALNAIPVVGALIGAGVNGWYLKDVAWAARHAFQERWLIDNHKVLEI
jgi:hypothetical protein